jgi:hypothetical protein
MSLFWFVVQLPFSAFRLDHDMNYPVLVQIQMFIYDFV